MPDSDDPHYYNISDLLKRPRLLLATILVMNNFVNVGVVTISTFPMWEMAATRNPSETIARHCDIRHHIFPYFFGEIIPKVLLPSATWPLHDGWGCVENTRTHLLACFLPC